MLYLLMDMNKPFSKEAFDTFFQGLKVTGLGMFAVLGVLFLFFLLVKLLIKMFPEKE